MSEKEKKETLLFLGALLIILFVVICGAIVFIKNKMNEEEIIAQQKVAIQTLQNEINNLKNQLQEDKNTVSQNAVANGNDEDDTSADNNISILTLQQAKELYDKTSALHWRSAGQIKYNPVEELVYSKNHNEEVMGFEILNFDEIVEVFSNNGKQQYLKNVPIFESNGKMYWQRADRGSDIFYVSTELVLKNSTNSKLEYIAKSKYVNEKTVDDASKYTGNNFRYEEKPFILVNENGKWVVEDFSLAY